MRNGTFLGRFRSGRPWHVATGLVLVPAAATLIAALGIGCGRSGGDGALLSHAGRDRSGEALSREDRSVVARTALTITAELAAVRGQVRADQLELAAEGLERARSLTELIAATAPTFNLRERVRIVRIHLSYQDPVKVVPELVPIERELQGLAWLLPIREAEEHLKRAREALSRGDRDAASRDLAALAGAVVYQEIDLPLNEVDADVVAAQEALQLRRLDEVDSILGRAESSLDVLTVWARGEKAPAPSAAPGP